MGYGATCDDCGRECHPFPALLAQFQEDFFRTHPIGGHLSNFGYDEGDTVTLCGDCTYELLNPDSDA